MLTNKVESHTQKLVIFANPTNKPKPEAIELNNKAVDMFVFSYTSDCDLCTKCQAINDLKKAIDIDSTYYGAYDNLMRYASEIKCYNLAIKYANRYIQKNPTSNLDIYGLRGLVYMDMGNQAMAQKDFTKQIQIYDQLSDREIEPIRLIIKAIYLVLNGQRDKAKALMNSSSITSKKMSTEDREWLSELRKQIQDAPPEELMKIIWN